MAELYRMIYSLRMCFLIQRHTHRPIPDDSARYVHSTRVQESYDVQEHVDALMIYQATHYNKVTCIGAGNYLTHEVNVDTVRRYRNRSDASHCARETFSRLQ